MTLSLHRQTSAFISILKKIILLSAVALFMLLTLGIPASQAATQCSYFNETFTGTASNTWYGWDATWVIKNGKLNG